MSKKIFWLFQITFWSVYFLYNILIFFFVTPITQDTNKFLLIIYIFLLSYFGIPLCTIAKRILNKYNSQFLNYSKILVVIVSLSIVLANTWSLEYILLDNIFGKLLSQAGHNVTYFNWRVEQWSSSFIHMYLWETFFASLLMFAWTSIYLFFVYWNQWNKQRFEIEKAKMQLELGQLEMLKSQISPHFLFNSLSSLRALIRKDSILAEEMLNKIADFLRYSLKNKEKLKVPFSEELKAIRNYFGIEKTRFGKKLLIEYNVSSETDDFPVPGFILHPIIENSIKYGMDTSSIPLRISVNAKIINNKLNIEIINSGKWIENEDGNNGTGTGLSNIQQRLITMYPKKHKFTITKLDDTVKVTLELENTSDNNYEKDL